MTAWIRSNYIFAKVWKNEISLLIKCMGHFSSATVWLHSWWKSMSVSIEDQPRVSLYTCNGNSRVFSRVVERIQETYRTIRAVDVDPGLHISHETSAGGSSTSFDACVSTYGGGGDDLGLISLRHKYSLLMHCIKIKSPAKSLLNEQYVFVGVNISFLCVLSCSSEEAMSTWLWIKWFVKQNET